VAYDVALTLFSMLQWQLSSNPFDVVADMMSHSATSNSNTLSSSHNCRPHFTLQHRNTRHPTPNTRYSPPGTVLGARLQLASGSGSSRGLASPLNLSLFHVPGNTTLRQQDAQGLLVPRSAVKVPLRSFMIITFSLTLCATLSLSSPTPSVSHIACTHPEL
jgi:hypothetical protein